MKKNKLFLGFLVLTITLLFQSNNVFAKEAEYEWGEKYILIDSASELREEFKGKSAIIEGTTITLTGDVAFENENFVEGSDDSPYSDVTFTGTDYVLNLNGHKLSINTFMISNNSLTINDETGEGEVNAFIAVEQPNETNNNPKLIINNGKFDVVSNWNATLEINDGIFNSIWLDGTSTINGGIYTSYIRYQEEIDPETGKPYWMPHSSQINIEKDITINGGEFRRNGLDYAVYLFDYSDGASVSKKSIEDLIGESYELEYEYCRDCEYNSENEAYYTSIKVTHPIFDKIIKNGVLTLNVEKPDNDDKAYFFLSEVVRNMAKTDKYYLEIAFPSEGDFNPENGVISLNKLTGEPITARKVKVVYKESSETASAKVSPIVKKIAEKAKDEVNIKNSFLLEDLYLINYLNSLKDGINSEMSLNFSKELIELTNGSNIAYKFDTRMGSSSAGLWFYLGGWGFIYYNGDPIDGAKIGITRSHVLYVPSDTKDTDEARIAAALKRIKDYLGTTDGIKIEVGGTLESTGSEQYNWNYYGLIDEKTSGKNYYNVTINGKTYMFAICKKDSKELENPKYIASDLMSNISIKSSSTELPLDTAITVKTVTSKEIEKALGTSVYAAYDISLYSNAKQVNITKLENGKFIVNIPVPEILKDKEITVYYINSKNQKEEYIATVKDDVASFETDHFSTYALAEKTNDIANPNTYDGISRSIILLSISLLGIISTVVCLKRKQENK